MDRSIWLAVALAIGCGPQPSDDSSGSGSGSGSGGDGSDGANSTAGSDSASGSTGAGAECDPLPVEGTPCSQPGEFCSGDCSDQCEFCNALECVDGAWRRLEAPPAPCLTCEEVCPFIVPAGCAAGPPDHAVCVTGCEDVRTGPCAAELSDTLVCIGESPTFTCDAEDRPVVAGCEPAFATLYACLGL